MDNGRSSRARNGWNAERSPDARGRANDRGEGGILKWIATIVIGLSLQIPTAAAHRHLRYLVPASFYPQALCVHDGWHYKRVWKRWRIRQATYQFGPYGFNRTWKTWSNGEGAWDNAGSYGGGMQFLVSTWNRAGGHARSTSDIARATPREQIYRARRIVLMDGGSWREWGGTKDACGLR